MSFELVLLVILLVILFYALNVYIHGNDSYWQDRGVPFIDIGSIVPFYKRLNFQGSTPELDREIYERLKGKKYGGYMELRTPIFFVRDLDLLKKILVKDFDHFGQRRDFELGEGEPLLARMLSQLKGKEWKDLRAVISPTFTTGKIRRMFEFFNASGHSLTTYLSQKIDESGGDSGVVDTRDIFGRYTMAVIASTAFGLKADTFEAKESMFRKMAKQLNNFSPLRMLRALMYMMVPSVANALKLSLSEPESTAFFSTIAHKTIEARKAQGISSGGKSKEKNNNDFLQIMLEAQAGLLKPDDEGDETDNGQLANGQGKNMSATILDDNTIIAQCLLFFSAGSVTVEAVLSFAVYELALNPEIQDKLFAEVKKSLEENGTGELTYEATNTLPYLDMVVSETLRRYPPAFQTDRTCTQEYSVAEANIILPKGSRTVIPIMSIHHDEAYYPNPDQFNPEHFTQENKAKRHPYTYLPFGQGPRNCVAMRFALTEVKAAIAHLVKSFRIEPCSQTQIPLQLTTSNFILEPTQEVFLKFTNRDE